MPEGRKRPQGICHLRKQLSGGLSREERFPQRQLCQDAAKGPDVDGGTTGHGQHHLRSTPQATSAAISRGQTSAHDRHNQQSTLQACQQRGAATSRARTPPAPLWQAPPTQHTITTPAAPAERTRCQCWPRASAPCSACCAHSQHRGAAVSQGEVAVAGGQDLVSNTCTACNSLHQQCGATAVAAARAGLLVNGQHLQYPAMNMPCHGWLPASPALLTWKWGPCMPCEWPLRLQQVLAWADPLSSTGQGCLPRTFRGMHLCKPHLRNRWAAPALERCCGCLWSHIHIKAAAQNRT